MKFLVDSCAASRTLCATLADAGHDVLRAADGYANAPDEFLLELANKQDRVLVTRDKDFGALVFRYGLPHRSVVRLVKLSPPESAAAMKRLIQHYATAMREGAIIVVTKERVRIRAGRAHQVR